MPMRILLLAAAANHVAAMPAIGAQSGRRFLLLHGSGTTAGAFLNSPTKLGAKKFLSGVPCRQDAGSDIPPNWMYTALDADSVDGDWFGKDFKGLDKSVSSICEEIEDSQSVGLIGHEHGATMAAVVAALSALGEGPPLKFAVICGAEMPDSGPVADLLLRLRDTPGALSIPTLHCISESDPNCSPEKAAELASCFGASAEILRHDSGVAMPPPSWWEETCAFPERSIGGNRWCTQYKGPFFYGSKVSKESIRYA